MLKRILPILIALSVLLTACGAQGTPTMAPADVEGTAVSSAWTMVAATQMAIPTATALPPTEVPSPTPLPTFTPPPALLDLPTATLFNLPTPTTVASGDDCNHPLNVGEAGETNRMRIENASGGTIAWLSLNLTKNKFGQCGAMSWSNIGNNAKIIVDLPKGIWWAYAGITYKNGSSSNASGSFEIRIGDEDLLRIIIGKEVITVHA